MKQETKCILLVRVSTERQEFDAQEKELYQLAIRDGYVDSNIIPVCEKESGIKLSEEERNGLNRMKEIISTEKVTCVFAWEPSRIARKKKILFSITDYLVSKNIQLVIKEPYIRLLNSDGTINDAAETVLTLYGQLAESEMRNKLARWRRAKAANSKAGIWNGGAHIRFGYTVDKDNRYIINEEEAKLVRLVYDMYTTTSMGIGHIQKVLDKRGYTLRYDYIQRILSFRGYTGTIIHSPYTIKETIHGTNETRWIKKVGHALKYPAIISEEMFEKAQQKKIDANSKQDKGHSYYFAKSLIICPKCGRTFIANKAKGAYACLAHNHNKLEIPYCDNIAAANINVMDSLLWDATVNEYIAARQKTTADNIVEYKKQIAVYKEVISSTEMKVDKLLAKKKRIAMTFANGDIDEDDYKRARSKVDDDIAQVRQDEVSAKERIQQIEKIINRADDVSYIDVLKDIAEEAFGYSDLQEMSELVHMYIRSVNVEVTKEKGPQTKHITIVAMSGAVYEYLNRYIPGKTRGQVLWKKKVQILKSVFDEWEEFVPDIMINRPLGYGDAKRKLLSENLIVKMII